MSKSSLAVWAILMPALAHAEPIRLHPDNPHCFVFRGKTVVLITSGEHYGAVLNGDFDFHRYLKTLNRDRLNLTRLFGGSYVEVPSKSFGILRNDLAPAPRRFVAPWSRSTVSGYAGGGNKFDLNSWNPDYFSRLRQFLGEAGRLGIVVELTLFSSQYGAPQWEVSPFHPDNNVNGTNLTDWKKLETLDNGNILAIQERYVRKLVHEVAPFDNVIFEIQNEPWSDRGELADVVNPYLPAPARDVYPNSVDVPDGLSLAWQARVAEWIADEEHGLAAPHLIAQNYCNFRFPVRRVLPHVSIVNFHYAYPEAVNWNYGLRQAIGDDETGFRGTGDEPYRRQAWNFMLAGGSTFDSLDYSFSIGHEDGSDPGPNGPGGGSATLRRQLRILRMFLDSFDLASMRPNSTVVVHAGGSQWHALSGSAGQYGVYFDAHGSTPVVLSLPAGEYSGEWIDAVTGASQKIGSFTQKGEPWRAESPDFLNGIALRLQRRVRR